MKVSPQLTCLSAVLLLVSMSGAARIARAELPAGLRPAASVQSQDGNFKINFPAAASKSEVKTPLGFSVYSHIAESHDAAFMVMYNDYPSGLLGLAQPAAMLKAGQDQAIRQQDGTLNSEKAISLGIYPGREFRFTAVKEGVTLKAVWRLYMVNNRLYQVAIVSPQSLPAQDQVDAFFNSFALLSE
jgi:hypothetical protein